MPAFPVVTSSRTVPLVFVPAVVSAQCIVYIILAAVLLADVSPLGAASAPSVTAVSASPVSSAVFALALPYPTFMCLLRLSQ